PSSSYSLERSGAGKPVFLVREPVISRRSSGLPPLLKLHSYLLPQECFFLLALQQTSQGCKRCYSTVRPAELCDASSH
ncbi:MAG: hypothetical protein ACK559_17985, partial [bacterium]